MIERVRTVGFKGFDLDEDVPQKVIYTGRNKSGKSTRAGAIALAVYGYIPFSDVGKRPGDILDSFGSSYLVAAVTIGGTEFARKFSRDAKGGVRQSMQIDQKRRSSENFAILLNRAGAPRIANVAEFMKQSDEKKTDTLFDLFPNKELSGIDSEIEIAKSDVSRLDKEKRDAESVVVSLTKSKTNIEIPPGNIAETQAEIKSVEGQITDLENQIKQAEIKEAEEKAKEKGRLEGERLEKERTEKEKSNAKIETDETGGVSKEEAKRMIGLISPGEDHEQDNSHGGHAFIDGGYPENEGRFSSGKPVDPIDSMISKAEKQIEDSKLSNGIDKPQEGHVSGKSGFIKTRKLQRILASQSILKIIDALEGAGCGTCAALIVAKQELKKYKGIS